VTGVLCAPGDVAGWTRTLAYLRDEPLLRESLGAAARRTAVAHHSWDRTIQTVLSFVSDTSAAVLESEKISA
jgi:glycosyltransferase involved in cell wall biosynthesis